MVDVKSQVEQSKYIFISLDHIVSKLKVRSLSAKGVARIKESMQRSGFLENYPLIVAPLGDGTYQLVDGNHRYEASRERGEFAVPCVVKDDLSEGDLYKLALQSNSAAETVVPSTLVTYAEFVWQRLDDGFTQLAIAEMLGWSRESVKDYASLRKICRDAWQIIGATFESLAPMDGGALAPSSGASAPFTERMLRSILHLTPEQQVELVNSAIHGFMSPGSFKERAANYRARNEMKDYALQQLGDLGEAYAIQLIEEIEKGSYDKDWKDDSAHPKLHKLITSLRDEWERKNSVHLVQGDFYEEVRKVGDGSADLVLTDPPYNIARDNEFELEGRANISQDYGEWDKYTNQQFIDSFSVWTREWARILRDQGSGYTFTSDSYISHLRSALEGAGLHVKATIIWHKTNPGTQIVKTNFKSSVEYILFFTKGQGGHTFNWQGENEMHNFIESPICAGNERVVDAKGNTLHPTQKPERVIRHLMEISSNRGDMVFDGFMGTGTTGRVSKTLGRKFIGIEQNKAFFDAAKRSLADA